MSVTVLNDKFEKETEVVLPESYTEVNGHNLYIYAKAYLANIRSATAHTKTRSDVTGGGKKPWRQKGTGRARAGSIASPVFVGGGVAHGPKSNRNYTQKVNKKQIELALKYAMNEKSEKNALFVADSLKVESGKTKDAAALMTKLNVRDCLVVVDAMDEKTFLAYRNLGSKAYLIEKSELDAYLVSTFYSVVFEKAAYDSVVKG